MTDAKKKNCTRRTLYYFLNATKRYMGLAIGGAITTPMVIFLRNILTPLLLADMIQIVSDGIRGEELYQALIPRAILLVAVALLRSFVLGPLRMWCVWKMEIKAMYDLSCKAFDTVTAQSMQFHSDRFSGSLVSQTNKFVGAYERLMDEFFWNIFPVALDILMIMIVMIPKAPLFVVGMVVFIIIYIVAAAIWFKKLAPIHEKEASTSNKCTGQLADSVSNVVSVKSYAREKYESARYAKYQGEWYKAVFDSLKQNTKRNFFFDGVGVGLIILVVVFMIGAQDWFGVSVATLVLIVNYSQNILGDLWSIHSVFKSMNRVFGDAREMTEILDMKDDVVDEPGAKKLNISKAKIDFDDITFEHKDAKAPIFENFSLEIQPGERVGLVGVSGSGKSTLTKLLLRFADVEKGEILIDGQNICNVTQKSLREAIAYVPQESSLFHRTVFDNIAYGRPNASKDEILKAAKLANADEFIRKLPDGYETMVGERGVKLSGGQRQRIAIARAILKDAPILVLDEATSALDSESEAMIQGALVNLMKSRTAIVVAHRLSTIAGLDKIVVLSEGKIIEQGTHAELLARGGEYHKLWSRQSGAFLDEE
ncbi:MAG: ABC transporter ATP-binding protein [Candidatus Saccharimonadaceae bacterium]|nr:ABC transporter ATP-binding protein [Candidatus Saccharimonadaceae bacterium]